MIKQCFKMACVVACMMFPMVSWAQIPERTALVIGNAAYRTAPLKNPVNDASDMARALEDSGFNVTLVLDSDNRTMERSIRQFGRQLRENSAAAVGLFYFAGHGIQVNGRNYLLPIGGEIETESDVKFEAVDAGFVLGKMEDAQNSLNIIILDACRNNPFARNFRSSARGLAKMDAPTGSIFAFSTAPGSLAADGEGRNSIYTKHLIRNMVKPGLKIEEVLKDVRVAVVSETSGRQVPWESSSLLGSFYFKPGYGGASTIQAANTIKSNPDSSYEILFWESIKDSENPHSFAAYLEQFPDGVFARLAKLREKELAAKVSTEKTKAEAASSRESVSSQIENTAKVAAVISGDKMPGIVSKKGSFILYENGILYDTETNLEWYQGPDKALLWGGARKWVSSLDIDGNGWQMPTKKQLDTLCKYGLDPHNNWSCNFIPYMGGFNSHSIWFKNSRMQFFYCKNGEGEVYEAYSVYYPYMRSYAVRVRK